MVDDFLTSFLKRWNGMTYRSPILRLVALLPPRPYEGRWRSMGVVAQPCTSPTQPAPASHRVPPLFYPPPSPKSPLQERPQAAQQTVDVIGPGVPGGHSALLHTPDQGIRRA